MAKRLVLVEWEDSATMHGWRHSHSLPTFGPVSCRTVGFVVGDDKRTLSLAQSSGDEGTDNEQFTEIMQIPKSAIKKRRTLK